MFIRISAAACAIGAVAHPGCALGSTRLGEQWFKYGATGQDRETAIVQCTELIRTQAAVDAPSYCPPILMPGHTACIVGTDIAARKEFSRNCTTDMGWALK
jgi:hypothetical protein